jgi:hypothetical protein
LPSLLPLHSQAQKDVIVAANNAQSQSATATSIFNNNLFIAGVSLIPYVGWGYIIFALWNTGTVIASYNQPWNWALNNLFAWIELGVYSYMILKSIKLWQLFKQRKTCFTDLDGKCVIRKTTGVWNEIVYTAMFSLIAACVVLLLSALLEYSVISRVILR